MAILKHIASKNANYGSAIDYLKYQHDEFHLVPVLDESGNMLLREEFYLDGLNCHPETFDLECELLNQEYNKTLTMKSKVTTTLSAMTPEITPTTI